MAAEPVFVLPTIHHSETGWGPPVKDDVIDGMPYQPFNKGERFGRVADWTGSGRGLSRYPANAAAAGPLNSEALQEDVEGFANVDHYASKQIYNPRRNWFRGGFRGRGRGGGGGFRGPPQGRGRNVQAQRVNKFQKSRNADWQSNRRQYVQRLASVEVRPSWKVVASFPLSDLQKLDGPLPANVKNLATCGQGPQFDNAADAVRPKKPAKLKSCANKTFFNVPAGDDEMMRDIMMDEEGEYAEGAARNQIFAIDSVMAAIMACPRSINSWDVQVDIMDGEDGGKIVIFDKREDPTQQGGTHKFDLLAVNETSPSPPRQDETVALAEELVLVNQKFSQHVAKADAKPHKPQGAKPNPFVTGEGDENPAHNIYRYRRWDLTKETQLICRTCVDGQARGAGLYKAFALLEHDSKTTDWKRKLETSAGAALATEIKNNSFLLARWTALSLLAGAEAMKIGYVSRALAGSRTEHQLLQTMNYSPTDFAQQLAIRPRTQWTILRTIVEQCLKMEEGRYVLLKDPNRAMLYMYRLPDEEDPDEEKESEGEGEF